jgi:hypothetical protein
MVIVLALNLGMFLKWLFLGTLRPPELEVLLLSRYLPIDSLSCPHRFSVALWLQRVNESIKFTFIETLIALLMFHEELGTNAMLLFLFKFFLKFFHVVVESRVELLEIDQGMTAGDRRRLLGLSMWLLGVDLLSFLLFLAVVQTNGISVVVLFAFEVGPSFRCSVHSPQIIFPLPCWVPRV